MAADIRKIYVYDGFSSSEPSLAGCLYITPIRGGENCAFEYDKTWLKRMSPAVSLDSELMPFPGRQYPAGKPMFGVFADAAPDRWGRVLMNKRERIKAERESRKPRKLYDSDYLIGVYDETRMGGLRFKEDPEGPFLSDDRDAAIPPWARLRMRQRYSVCDGSDRNCSDSSFLINRLILTVNYPAAGLRWSCRYTG